MIMAPSTAPGWRMRNVRARNDPMEWPIRNTGRPGNACRISWWRVKRSRPQSPSCLWTEVEPGRTGSHRCTGPSGHGCHGNAPSRQKCGQRLIAQNVLRHTVGELQNSPDRAIRHPVHGVQGGFAVRGGDREFSLEHGKTNLPVVYCHQQSKDCFYDSTAPKKCQSACCGKPPACGPGFRPRDCLRQHACRAPQPLRAHRESFGLWRVTLRHWIRNHQLPGHPVQPGRGDRLPRPAPLPPDLSPARLGGARSHGDLVHFRPGTGGGGGQRPHRPQADRRPGHHQPAETTILWDRSTGQPVCNAIVWQCRRTAPLCDPLKADGLGEPVTEKTGL